MNSTTLREANLSLKLVWTLPQEKKKKEWITGPGIWNYHMPDFAAVTAVKPTKSKEFAWDQIFS